MELKWLSFENLKESILKEKRTKWHRTRSSAIEDQETTTTLNNSSILGSLRSSSSNRDSMEEEEEERMNTPISLRALASRWKQSTELTTATGVERLVSLRSARLGIPTLDATPASSSAPITPSSQTTDLKTNSTSECEQIPPQTTLSESDPHPWLTMALIQDLLSSIRDSIIWSLSSDR